MSKREFVCLILLLISKWTGVVANTTPDKLPRRSALLSLGTAPEIKYDVFVCFRGPDIRKNFLSHIIEALCRKDIIVFSDKTFTPSRRNISTSWSN